MDIFIIYITLKIFLKSYGRDNLDVFQTEQRLGSIIRQVTGFPLSTCFLTRLPGDRFWSQMETFDAQRRHAIIQSCLP